MKKLILTAGLMTVGLFATDFSQKSIAELNAMKGSVSTQDKNAYKAEVQKRVKAMDEADRNNYRTERGNSSSSGKGSGKQHRHRHGSGGSGKHGGGGGGRR